MEYTLITGASSGVGRELAVFLSGTHNLILNGRDGQRLQETKAECSGEPLIWRFDLADVQNVEAGIADFIRENGIRISSFVHCAGVMKMVPLRAVTVETMHAVYAVNVFAPAMIAKAAAARKVNGKALRSVVFISSNISSRGAAAFSAYGSSKAALDGLMRNLAVELAPDVRVNSVLPGGMVTEMTKDIFADEGKKAVFEKNYPLGIGTPADIAAVVGFLLSDQSRWMTGQQVTVDGGRTINITERSK